jgi:hypothetical protein
VNPTGEYDRGGVTSERARLRSSRPWAMVGWATVGYAGLTVLMTWPMAIRVSSPYATIWQDFGLWLWDIWWIKWAVADLGVSPYFTKYIFYPTGTSLAFHNLSPYNGFLGIPFQLLGSDVITTYNLLYLSSFVIGGVGVFLLVTELIGNAFAAFLAGAVYAFSPFHTITYAWMNLWATQWLPFALLFAVRMIRVGRPMDSIGLAVSLLLATLTDWHQPVFLLLTIMLLSLSSALSRRQPGMVRPGVFRRLLWSLLLYGLFVSPLAYVVLRELTAGATMLQTPSWFREFELLGYRRTAGDTISYTVLLGWTCTACVIYGMARGLDFWTKRFAALLVLFFLLSLGEGLRVPGVAEPVLPLPFLLWRKIPLLGSIRGSVYFWIMVQVCFAVLVGHGARRIWERLRDLWPERFSVRRLALASGLFGLMLVEFFQGPFTPTPLRIHPVYEAIRRDAQTDAILDAPIGYTQDTTRINAGRSMFLQTFHHHPLVGGHTQFDGKERLAFLGRHPELVPFIDHWVPRDDEVPEGTEEALRSFVTRYRIGWIILRKSMRDPACEDRSERVLGWSMRKFVNLVAPAVMNEELRALWKGRGNYCWGWDAARASKADALVRRTLGPPVWDDAELTAYRLR